MSFINVRENVFNFEYYVSTNSWPWFPIVGSSSSFRPFGTSSSTMHRLRKSLCDLYLTALSLSRFSFSAICSLFFLMILVVVNSALFHYSLPQLVLMLKFDPLVLLELAHLVFFWMVFCYFLRLRL